MRVSFFFTFFSLIYLVGSWKDGAVAKTELSIEVEEGKKRRGRG